MRLTKWVKEANRVSEELHTANSLALMTRNVRSVTRAVKQKTQVFICGERSIAFPIHSEGPTIHYSFSEHLLTARVRTTARKHTTLDTLL